MRNCGHLEIGDDSLLQWDSNEFDVTAGPGAMGQGPVDIQEFSILFNIFAY